MSEIFVISDPHFGHEKVIDFGERPFKNIEEMEESIITLWNYTVSKRDVVIILGDWCFKANKFNLAQELNGLKRLVLGNHDTGNLNVLRENFHTVHGSLQKHEFLFTHIPIIMDTFHHYEYVVHGHIHKAEDNIKDWRYFNANMDALKYYGPISFDEIKTTMRNRKLEELMGIHDDRS